MKRDQIIDRSLARGLDSIDLITLRKKDRKQFAIKYLKYSYYSVRSNNRFRVIMFLALLLFFASFFYYFYDLAKAWSLTTMTKHNNPMIDLCLRGSFTFDALFNAYTGYYGIDNNFSKELRNIMLKSTDSNRNAFIDNKNECEIFDKHFNIFIS